MEGDITELADELFKDDPKAKNSYSISFEDYNIKEVFESLMYLLSECVKRKFFYHKPVNIEELSFYNFEKINKYMNSIGIEITLNIYNSTEWNDQNIILYDKLIITNHTKLNEFKFMIKKSNYYIIYFDFV